MSDNQSKSIDRKLDFISGYQMLGGIIGLAFMIYMFFNIAEIDFAYVLVIGIGGLLYTFSFTAGLLLYQRRKSGMKLSILNQLLQVFGFSIFGFGIEFVSGLSIALFLRNTNGFDFSLTFGLSNWHILFNNDAGIQEISINIVALFILFYLLKLRKINKLANATNEATSIGIY